MALSFKNHKLNFNLFIFFFPLILISCAGGGGGGGNTNTSGTCKDGNSSSFCTTEFHANYGLKNIKAYEAYDDGYSGSGVKVSVMDGGFDLDHSQINYANNGYDGVNDDNNADSESPNGAIAGHGTHVAGIIGAKRDSTGMHGVAYASTIVPVRILTDSNSGISDMTASIDYASSQSNIVNNSWGSSAWTSNATCTVGGVNYTCRGLVPATSSSGFNSSAERAKWNDFSGSDDAVAVFAAGNNGVNSKSGQIKFYTLGGSYLTSYDVSTVVNAGVYSYSNRSSAESRYPTIYGSNADNWLVVVNVDSDNTISSSSNGCGDAKNYCIAAPGTNIYSTVPTSVNSSGYASYSGTSMAAPHVSGALALLKQKWPNLSAAQLVDIVLANATDLGSSGTDEVYGVGLLNLSKSMQASGALEITYADDNGNLRKYLVSDSMISSNSLLSNLNKDIDIGVVDEYDRVYSVKLNDLNSQINQQRDLYILERNLTAENRYAVGGTQLFYINNHFEKKYNKNFKSKKRIYDYDLLSYEKFIFNGAQNFHFPIGSAFILTTDAEKLENYILKSNFYYSKSKYDLDMENGFILESESMLGSKFSGAFSLKESKTYFSKIKNSFNLDKSNKLKLNLSYGLTQVDFNDSKILNMSDIHTFDSTFAYEKTFDSSKLSLSYQVPLHISRGNAEFNNVSGYNSNGDYKNGVNSINLSKDTFQSSINFYYDLNINNNSDFGIHYSIDSFNDSKIQLAYNKAF